MFEFATLGSDIGRGIARETMDAANNEVMKAGIKGAEDLPIIGGVLKDGIKKWNLTKEHASKFLDHIFDSNDHKIDTGDVFKIKEDFLNKHDVLSAHKKLLDDLTYSENPGKLKEGEQPPLLRRKKGTSARLASEDLYRQDGEINPDFVNDDGSIKMDKLRPKRRDAIEQALKQDKRTGLNLKAPTYDIDTSLGRKFQEGNFDKFTQKEKRLLHPEMAGLPKSTPISKFSPRIVESGLPESTQKAFDKFSDFIPESDLPKIMEFNKKFLRITDREFEQIRSKAELSNMFDKKLTVNSPHNTINESIILEGVPKETIDDMKFAKNLRTGNDTKIVLNPSKLTGNEVKWIEEYNEKNPESQVKSIDQIALSELPELQSPGVKPSGLDIRTLDNLSEKDFAKFMNKKIDIAEDFVSEDKGKTTTTTTTPKLEKPTISELEQQMKESGVQFEGDVELDPPTVTEPHGLFGKTMDPNLPPEAIQMNPDSLVQFDEDGNLLIHHASDLEVSKLAQLKELLKNAPEDIKDYIIESWQNTTYGELLGMGGTSAATLYGFYRNKKNMEFLGKKLKGLSTDTKNMLGIDDDIIDAITGAMNPENIRNEPLRAASDNIEIYEKMIDALFEAQKNEKQALQIFNQPSSSSITNRDNQRKLENVEKKTRQLTSQIKRLSEKIKKQTKLAMIESKNIEQKTQTEQKKDDEQKKAKAIESRKKKPIDRILGGDKININISPQQVQQNNPYPKILKTTPIIQDINKPTIDYMDEFIKKNNGNKDVVGGILVNNMNNNSSYLKKPRHTDRVAKRLVI